MPGQGRSTRRSYTPQERAALETEAAALGLAPEAVVALLGREALDASLNPVACWSCVPEGVWSYTLGGYQVLKRWLSYRERPLLGRDLTREEARTVTEIVRRIAALLLLGPALDAAYAAVGTALYAWPAPAA